MGSPLRLQVHEPGIAREAPAGTSVSAAALWARVDAEFEASEAALSRFRERSGLTRLNRSAGSETWYVVEGRLYRLLAASERARRLTGGRFDPRVLADLERLGYRGAALPPARPGAIVPPGAPEASVPWLKRDPCRQAVSLSVPVDSGGIGKGLALRWAWRAIEPDLGGRGALLEAGGDLVGLGPGPDGGAWLIGLEDPAGGSDPLAAVLLEQGALCSSSIAVTHWQARDGRAVHHLLDPQTGEPGGEGLRAVTVAASDPAWAEVWSKALFLAGSLGIGEEARARDLAAWWVEADGSLHMTPAARLRTTWTGE